MKKGFLARLILVTLAEPPRDVATELVDIALSDDTDAGKAEDIGETIDDAIVLSGPVGSILEGFDDVAAERLADISLELIGQTRARVVEKLSDRIEEAEEQLRDRGVPESAIDAMREILRLDDLAA